MISAGIPLHLMLYGHEENDAPIFSLILASIKKPAPSSGLDGSWVVIGRAYKSPNIGHNYSYPILITYLVKPYL